ncbi:Rv3235 family protein [Actinomadura sp. SCN-SB]|uniref:Rv3235 family protein n=1 Tax=Actinomadura sp. SCN-SB TaxID=3373092 RepID=UPI0037511D40
MREARRLPALVPGRPTTRRPTVVRISARIGPRHTDGALALAPANAARERRRSHLAVAGAPPPRETAETTLRLIIEVLAGTRPPRHLAGRAVPDVWQGLAVQRTPARRTPVAPPRILRTWLQDLVPGALETGAVVRLGGHVHALAVRLEHTRGDWRCTALETTIPATHRAK